jgi:hypothetical protein
MKRKIFCDIFLWLLIFAKIFLKHGEYKKEHGHLVAGIPGFNRCFRICNCYALGVSYPHHALRLHFVCKGAGYYLRKKKIET